MSGAAEVIEGGAELAALGGAAAALDAEVGASDFGPAPAAQIEPAQQADPSAETAAVIGLVVGMLTPMLPYLPAIYTDDKVRALAGAYVPVAQKYGWDSGGWFDRYGAEIMLAGVGLPLLAQTRAAHQAWAADKRREERARVAAPGVAEAAAPEVSQAVQFGTAAPVEVGADGD